MTQKGKEGKSKNAIGRMSALRWEPTYITKHFSRSIPLQLVRKYSQKWISDRGSIV